MLGASLCVLTTLLGNPLSVRASVAGPASSETDPVTSSFAETTSASREDASRGPDAGASATGSSDPAGDDAEAPAADDSEGGSDETDVRTYTGPRAATPPEETAEVEPEPPQREAPVPHDATLDAAVVEVQNTRRPVPRVLSTIEGNPIDEQAVIGRGKVKFFPGFQVRNQVGYVSPFTLDRYGNRYEEREFTNGRIRWNPRVEVGKKFKIVGMVDFMNGRWAPAGSEDPVIDEIMRRGQPPGRADLPQVGPRGLYLDDTGPAILDFRELYLEYRFSLGLVRFGQQAFTWGLGILANDGNNIDRFGDMKFGFDSRGDIYERLLFLTRPFAYRPGKIKHLIIGAGADLVFRDERASLMDNDIAGQAILLARYQPENQPGNWFGGYVVYRHQRSADDGDVYPNDDMLQVFAADIAGQGTLWLRDDLQLIGAFETAMIGGRSSWLRDAQGTHRIIQGGGAARAYIGNHDKWLAGFDAGYASGDANPNDRRITNFTFDAGHTVGLVLFNQVNGWRTAQSEILATNGELTGVPLNGTELIPTRGGVTNAIYAHPKFRYALLERFEVWGGPLIAAAPVPIVDPFTTRLNGGVPTNSVGGDGGRRFYGTELDLGVRGRFDIKNLWLQASLQGGLLMPGAGLANAMRRTDGPVGAVFLRTEIRY